MAITQYIGSRYVPLFADPIEWSSNNTYEPLTIVTHEGNSYTSRQSVPKDIDIDNETFWALTGNYNAQVEQYRREVAAFDGRITTNTDNITAANGRIDDEVLARSSADTALGTRIDDEVLARTNGLAAANDRIDATNQDIADFIDGDSFNRAISDSYALFTYAGKFTLASEEHTQGMTIDEDGNFYVVIGNNIGNAYKLRKYDSQYNYVGSTSLPTNAHGNGLDYNASFGILVFDSPTHSLYQYDKNLNLINTLSATLGLGSGAIQQVDSNPYVMVWPSVGNRVFIYSAINDVLTRIGEIDAGSTNACYQQDCFGGSNTFYQLFSKTDEFKHSFVRLMMYRGRKIRDLFVLGIEGELEGIARHGNSIYICDYSGSVYTSSNDDKWSFSAQDTATNTYSNNFAYSSSLKVTTHDVSFTNADNASITATMPWQLHMIAAPFGNVQNFAIPLRIFNGKLAELISVNGNLRLTFTWFGIQIVMFYSLLSNSSTYQINGVDTYINNTRRYVSVATETDLDNLATIFANTHSYQIDTGIVLPPSGIYQNYIDESLSNKQLARV